MLECDFCQVEGGLSDDSSAPPPSETQMKRNAEIKKPVFPDKGTEERSRRMLKELSWGDERR